MARGCPRGTVSRRTVVGVLTLNVLLSFAQFEREVTSERIRDKIAASKRKGLWVGGNLPLGYRIRDGKIAIVEEEAELVRSIYRRYLELGSVNELVRDLRERNIKTKSRKLSTGRTRGGVPFGRGALYYLLSNHFYIGEVKYKNEILLHGEAKTAAAGSISRVSAAEIEETVVKFLKQHLVGKDHATANSMRLDNNDVLTELVAGIVVHRDRMVVRLKPDSAGDASDTSDDRSLTIPWQKPPSKRARQILLPNNTPRSEVRPQQLERRLRLVSAIARGRRWLDDVVSGRVTNVAQLCAREKCSVRQVNMTISLAFLAPNLVKAAVEGRLHRGVGIERLRDLPSEWSRQFEVLGLNPE
jgi:hypothetical protein